jgi:hypothetical protein
LRPTSLWKILYLARFSKPKSDRLIYRTMLRQKPRRIVELGLAHGQRALRLIDVAARYLPREQIHYIGIDPFEDRSAGEGAGLTLLQAHRLLKASGARIQLVPGNPWETLIRMANHLGPVDLLLISGDVPQDERHAGGWFYVSRLLHDKTVIFRDVPASGEGLALQAIDRRDIAAWAAVPRRRNAA